jgi:mRNA interferase YafQ
MYSLSFSTQFKKDYKKIIQRGLAIEKLHKVFEILEKTGTLPISKYKTHLLKGNYKNHYEAHIESDWLIIWFTVKDNEINLVRTGTHSDLF